MLGNSYCSLKLTLVACSTNLSGQLRLIKQAVIILVQEISLVKRRIFMDL